ncbi:hypothetical protein [Burkholderia vietnamiensis]|jgi:hypothetical protein|uniref:hypothetical protein n=1 Tax=Burkholderia vietnamiensis TaxID=60552 RepID=UPI0013F178FF|nr:hypothetical protein [Burkholderia vietnamiensis]
MSAPVYNGGGGFVPSQNLGRVSPEMSYLPDGYYPTTVSQAVSALTPRMYRAALECHSIHGAGYGAILANLLGNVSFAVAGNLRIRDCKGKSMPLILHIRLAAARLSGKSTAHYRFVAPVKAAMRGWQKSWQFDNVTLAALLRRIRGGCILSMLSTDEGRCHLRNQLSRSFHDLSELYD